MLFSWVSFPKSCPLLMHFTSPLTHYVLCNWVRKVGFQKEFSIILPNPFRMNVSKELKVTGRKLSIALIAHLLLMFFNFLFSSIVVICHINSIFYKFLKVITKWSRRSNKIKWRLTTCTNTILCCFIDSFYLCTFVPIFMKPW